VKILVAMAFFWQMLFSFLVARLQGISYNNEWIRSDIRTKIHLRSQRANIRRIHHFSGHSKTPPIARPSYIVKAQTQVSDMGQFKFHHRLITLECLDPFEHCITH
jgi:hypothetical protein